MGIWYIPEKNLPRPRRERINRVTHWIQDTPARTPAGEIPRNVTPSAVRPQSAAVLLLLAPLLHQHLQLASQIRLALLQAPKPIHQGPVHVVGGHGNVEVHPELKTRRFIGMVATPFYVLRHCRLYIIFCTNRDSKECWPRGSASPGERMRWDCRGTEGIFGKWNFVLLCFTASWRKGVGLASGLARFIHFIPKIPLSIPLNGDFRLCRHRVELWKKEVRFAKGLVAYTQPYHIILRPQCVAVGQRIEKILCVCSTTFRLMTETLNE